MCWKSSEINSTASVKLRFSTNGARPVFVFHRKEKYEKKSQKENESKLSFSLGKTRKRFAGHTFALVRKIAKIFSVLFIIVISSFSQHTKIRNENTLFFHGRGVDCLFRLSLGAHTRAQREWAENGWRKTKKKHKNLFGFSDIVNYFRPALNNFRLAKCYLICIFSVSVRFNRNEREKR